MATPQSRREVFPAILEANYQQSLALFYERCPAYKPWLQTRLQDEVFAQQLATTWSCSLFAAEQCLRRPEDFKQLIERGEHLMRYDSDTLSQRLLAKLSAIDDKKSLDQQLRQFRNREMLRIIWRDFNRLADMVETTSDISHLADATIQQALEFHHRVLAASFGEPHGLQLDGANESLQPQQLVVLGMGKLGAYELNLSSDIDLIFCFPEAGETLTDGRGLDNHSFFSRLGQRLIQSLDTITADGFVFRVDMRLRPYGDSGPLVQSFAAMEEYYQDQGRDWERYAMIKARVVAGPKQQAQYLNNLLKPFTYRRYIDFSAIDALRAMKQKIRQELLRRQLAGDIKLGAGGIRELEFIVQSFQLIRGGREPELQARSLLSALDCLSNKGYLPAEVVAELAQAYHFLRNSEHAIQGFQDRQTQQLPSDDQHRAAIAYTMGFAGWDDYETTLQQHRGRVTEHFSCVISDQQEQREQRSADLRWQGLWLDDMTAEAIASVLEQGGHEQPNIIAQRLIQLKQSQMVARMQAQGRERLDQFIPLLIQAVARVESPSQSLLRIFPLVEAVLRRTAYLVLLVENQAALKELVRLCAASPWISSQLARHPVLLDELLNATSLYHVPKKAELRDDLQQQILRLPLNDLEAHMDTLRYFRLAHVLKVAACEVSQRLPLMEVSDYLTWIAEVILEHVLAVAWHNLEERHGRPQQSVGVPCERRFIVLGYGKLGGIELGHGSDLDLVFLHDVPTQQFTDGERAIDNSTFMTRLGQRMIHILTTQTQLGVLYETDMRLRPSGESGLLTTSITAYEHYLKTDAWVWEHQALVRARMVAGSEALAEDFEQVRQTVLAISRDEKALQQEVVAMRQKMRGHLLAKPADKTSATDGKSLFAIKQGLGGIVDIEFMVQYAVLAWSKKYPALAAFTDNIRILETLQNEGLFTAIETRALIDAYKVYRSQSHRLSLQQQAVLVPDDSVVEQRLAVQQKWRQLFPLSE